MGCVRSAFDKHRESVLELELWQTVHGDELLCGKADRLLDFWTSLRPCRLRSCEHFTPATPRHNLWCSCTLREIMQTGSPMSCAVLISCTCAQTVFVWRAMCSDINQVRCWKKKPKGISGSMLAHTWNFFKKIRISVSCSLGKCEKFIVCPFAGHKHSSLVALCTCVHVCGWNSLSRKNTRDQGFWKTGKSIFFSQYFFRTISQRFWHLACQI